ncbi:cobalt ABC transporter permease [Salmonella enterica]|nr:cobalt ABC transporter permease [Salmonella enterica]
MNSRTSAVEKTATGVPDRVEFVGVPVGHHTQPDNFNLEQFEFQVTQPDTELAARMLFFLLEQLDSNYGQWGPQFSAYSPGTALEGLNPVLCTRIAGAVTTLFSRPDFTVSDGGYIQLMNLHRWLALIFAVSLYRHADHIIRNINAAGGGVVDPLTLNGHNLRLFCLCYFPDSQIALQPDVLWQYDRRTVARLFLALISGRVLPTPAAHGKREQLLAWLPERLAELDSLDFLPTAVLHDVYMHCSYADLAEKHRIKRSLNDLIRRSLLAGDFADIAVGDIRVPADAMPFVPPADIRRVPVTRTPFLTRQQAQWREPLPVRVAVCASVMKINPNFLSTLAEVQRRSRVAMQFCFYMGFAQGLTLDYLRDAIHAVLPGAEVNGHMPVQAYQAALNSCELFVSPFPYGNMNGVVDAVRQGLPGVCLSGPEVHSHIDGGLFRRLGLPEELIATGYEAYIRAVLRLVEEHDWREMLQHRLLDNDVEQVLFQGHPEKFAAVISDAWQQVRLGVVPSGTVPKARRRKSL